MPRNLRTLDATSIPHDDVDMRIQPSAETGDALDALLKDRQIESDPEAAAKAAAEAKAKEEADKKAAEEAAKSGGDSGSVDDTIKAQAEAHAKAEEEAEAKAAADEAAKDFDGTATAGGAARSSLELGLRG